MKTKLIRVKYLPVTNFKPSRIKLIDEFGKQSVIISCDHPIFHNIHDIATEWLTEHGAEIVTFGELTKEYIICVKLPFTLKETK